MTGARIYFEVFDETAADEAAFSSTLAQPWVDYGSLTDGLYPDDDPENPTLRQFVTGEPNAASLGGSVRLFPDSPGASLGYWSSNLSGEDGAFAAPPVLVCGFGGTAHTSVGVTVYFDLHACLSDFKVEWLSSSGTALATQTVTGNTAPSVFIEEHVEEYYGLRITCQKTADPYRYAKIQEIEFGQRMVYDEHNLVSASAVEEVDLSGASVPAWALQLNVFDPDGRLNPVNPDGIYTYLRRGMPLHVEFIVDSARYPGGLYYLDTWEGSNTGTARIKAMDAVGFSDKNYESIFYSAISPGALLDEIAAVMGVDGQAEAAVPVSTLTGYVPRSSIQEALAHVSLSAGGFTAMSRSGTLWLRTIPDDAETLSRNKVFGEPDVTRLDQPQAFEVEVNDYTVTSTGLGNMRSFSPVYGYPTGTTIRTTEYFKDVFDHALYADVHPQNLLNILDIKGYADRVEFTRLVGVRSEYSFSDKPVTAAGTQVVVDGDESNGAVSISGVPLITKSNYQAVLSAAKAYYGRTLKVKAKTIWHDGLECGACVTVPTRFGTVTGNIARMDIDLTGGMLVTMEVIA